jgi:hypothetical protein
MATTSEVLDAAMHLKSEDRAEVAHKLLLSLEPDDFDDDVDRAWANEVRRRLKAIREGRSNLRDWNDALLDIRQSIESKGEA